MENPKPLAMPTATVLKKELRESLALLRKDFANLEQFVAEIASDGVSPSLSLTKEDRDELLSVTLEIRDAASNIEFEANKIREKLDRLGA